MRRWYFGLAAFLSALGLALAGIQLCSGDNARAADAAPKIAGSTIVKVTVYPHNALVTREIDVPAGNGLAELVVSPLPDQVMALTLYAEGSDGIRILTTRFRTRQVMEDTSEERRKIDAEKEKLQVALSKLDSEIGSTQKNMELLNKLETFTEKTTVHSTEKGGLNGDTVITLVKFVIEQRSDKAKDLVGLSEQKRQLAIQMAYLDRKLAELGHGSGREERDAVVVVDRDAAKAGKVRLNYLVGSVSWRPEYKLRAAGVEQDVQVDCLAGLKQQSGEDWNQVELTLSTAQPSLNAAPPELGVLFPTLVARGSAGVPPMPAGVAFDALPVFSSATASKEIGANAKQLRLQALNNYRSGKVKDSEDADRFLNEAAAQEQQIDLMKSRDDILAHAKKGPALAAAESNEGPSVTYHLAHKLTVPSRNDDQVVEVAKLKLTPKYYYKAVPVLNRHVYRLADLVNKSTHILLPGEATMYQGTDFVGRMAMPLVAVGEEFTAGFGVDPQLQIQRQLVDKSRTTQGGNQVLKYEYRILVNSFKKDAVKLQVWDRLPHAEAESVNVSLVKATPELSKDAIYTRECRANNLLRWDLDVEPNRNAETAVPITYEFRMELDRQMAITGFQSR